MKYNFDELVNRRNTKSEKWDLPSDNNVIPMWVADMDFKAPPAVVEAIQDRANHAVFGYAHVPQSYYDAIVHWFKKRHQFSFQSDWILYTTGVVPALTAALKAITKKGDQVIIQGPVYNCFYSSIPHSECEIIHNDLIYKDGLYTIDFDDLEVKAKDPKTSALVLCNPHNPVGRVWTKNELQKVGEICLRNNVFVISDEIHCDLIHNGHKHIPFGSISNAFLMNSITCMAPTKTFNLAGLQVANIMAANPDVRENIKLMLHQNEVNHIGIFGVEALIAAYTYGEEWLDQLIPYLWDNYLFVKDFFSKKFPQLPILPLEGTYLVWIDVSSLTDDVKKLVDTMLEEEKVWVNHGTLYGEKGEGFLRLNIACPRATLAEGLKRIKTHLDKLL